MTGVVVVGLLAGACGGSSDDAVSVSDPDGVSATPTDGAVSTDSVEPPATDAAGLALCGGEPDADFLARMSEAILARYQEGAAIDTSIVGSQCVGESECAVHTTEGGFKSLTRVIAYPDGEFQLERELGDTPELTGDVLARCFESAGLEPTPADIALVQASMWSTFLSIEPSGFPPEGLAELSDSARELPIDFENYDGPFIEEVDGVRTLYFVAQDQLASFYVVQSLLDPEIESRASVVYSG